MEPETRVSDEELVEEGRKRGVEVTIRERREAEGSGEIVPLPGLSRRRGEDLLEDDDGSGVVE